MREVFVKVTWRVIAIFLLSAKIMADPAPFGLELNKTTIAELKQKFETTALGSNKNNGLQAFDIDPKLIPFEGLIAAKAAFSEDGILQLVQMSLPSAKFAEVAASLAKKYTLIYKNAPQDGNQEAKFEKDNTYILLYALQNSAEMDFLYINKQLLDRTLAIKESPNNTVSTGNEISLL